MKTLTILLFVVGSTLSNPLLIKPLSTKVLEKLEPEAKALPPLQDATVAYALDLSASVSQSTFQCIKSQGYSTVFVRVYNPQGNGAYDSNGGYNVKNAYAAGLGTEIYMTPQPSSSKSAAQQVDEIYQGLNSAGVTVRTLWIQVTSPINWPNNQVTNQNFITALTNRAKQYNWATGIYTSSYDWNQITGAWSGLTGTSLWYWSVNGNGPSGETPPNFQDFRNFGCWTSAVVKQFGQAESVCSVNVNRDVYYSSVTAVQQSAVMENGKIVVGTNVRQ
ncbi:unnamed protein product, partial [Mesorhabditis belari]|uniref:Lysozyme n=1 Tax=Mesorhabditis belari TaxID=2138241 RepID=A0AAF3EZT3_9BILA